jgi:hypothetical protein
MKNFSLSLSLLLILCACKKTEGEGGTSNITGKIYVEDYNNLGQLINEYDGAKEDVYIIYGDDDNVIDDKVEASFDGTFEFKYLEEGTYTIFAYEDCNECPAGEKAVTKTITIDKKKSTADAGVITIRK